jgi:hypothetical protein
MRDFAARLMTGLVVVCWSLPARAQAPVALTSWFPESLVSNGSSPGAFHRVAIEPAIRSFYDRFSEVGRLSGQEILFDISDIRTYDTTEIGAMRLLDLVEPHGGPILKTDSFVRGARLPSQEWVSFRSEWRPGDAEGAANFARFAADLTFAQYLGLLDPGESLRRFPPAGYSTYAVALTFDGKVVHYRALISWTEISADLLHFRAGDEVVPQLAAVFEETRSVVTLDRLKARPQATALQQPTAFCVASNFLSFGRPVGINRTEGHNSGFHESYLSAPRRCQTTELCRSTCTIEVPTMRCQDTGSVASLLYNHTPSNGHYLSEIDGEGVGLTSECGYGYGCAIQQCLRIGGCNSSLNFTAQRNGAGAEMSVSGANLFTSLNVASGAVCPAARFAVPLPRPCDERQSSAVGLNLEGSGAPVELGTVGVPLTRLEPSTVVHHGQEVRYLMAEWALVEATTEGVLVRQRSSDTFSDSAAKELFNAMKDVPATGKRLFVAIPTHEANSRRIAIPELRLAESNTKTRGAGRILVLADFDESRRLQGLEVLDAGGGAATHPVMLHLEQTLNLAPTAEGPHRVVSFVWLAVGDGKVEIDSSLSYLPRCCCGTEFCV